VRTDLPDGVKVLVDQSLQVDDLARHELQGGRIDDVARSAPGSPGTPVRRRRRRPPRRFAALPSIAGFAARMRRYTLSTAGLVPVAQEFAGTSNKPPSLW